MELTVYSRAGEAVGTMDFDESCLGDFVNRPLLHQAIVMYEANRRQGTAKTKTVSEVVGKSAKPFRQKGTGRARMGKTRRFGSRKGGTCFGPVPRDHSLSMPRFQKRLALKSALLAKFRDGSVKVLESFEFSEPKTREAAATFKGLHVDNGCLLVLPTRDANVLKSVRNLPRAGVSLLIDLNAYEVLRRPSLVFTKAALELLPEEVH